MKCSFYDSNLIKIQSNNCAIKIKSFSAQCAQTRAKAIKIELKHPTDTQVQLNDSVENGRSEQNHSVFVPIVLRRC